MASEDLFLVNEKIKAIPDHEILKLNMPISEAIQEAENLAVWCTDDREDLEKAGLDWPLVEELPTRAGACRYAQSIWAKESKIRAVARQEWKDRSPGAFELRDELLHHFTYAFRKMPDQLNTVQTIREGDSNADMLQDLSDLKVLGDNHRDPLIKVGMDMTLLTKAGKSAEELSVILAKANEQGGDDNQAKTQRDKCYTYMKQAVDEIRSAGQYVFWRNEDRKKGYVSAYKKRTR